MLVTNGKQVTFLGHIETASYYAVASVESVLLQKLQIPVAVLQISHDNGYIYIAVLNITSTMVAVYGLLLLQKVLKVSLISLNVFTETAT